MTDRELLELAAKAAGMKILDIKPLGALVKVDQHPLSFLWNPLTDDGDALRLAVKLDIFLAFNEPRYNAKTDEHDRAVEIDFFIGQEPIKHEVYEIHNGNDPYAATRMAIVRAAAEIGKGME